MNELLRANVRAHARRYVATGLAVIISTAFIMVFLAIGTGMNALFASTVRNAYQGASTYVGVTDSFEFTDEGGVERYVDDIGKVEGVRTVVPDYSAYFTLSHDGKRLTRSASAVRPEPFHSQAASTGSAPTTVDEILLDSSAAKILGAGIGDTISTQSTGPQGPVTASFTVSGIYEVGPVQMPGAVFTSEGLNAATGGHPTVSGLLIAGASDEASPAEQQDLTGAVASALGPDSGTSALTKDAIVDKALSGAQMDSAQSEAILLAFPAISALVAAIVVATTFQVIMAQRRRELALLRTLGATRAQVRSIVVREAVVVGAVSSLIGVALGAAIGGVVMSVLFKAPLATAFASAFSPTQMGATWLVGAIMTLVAGIRPALAMGRLSPIEALAANEAAASTKRRHRLLFPLSLVVFALSGSAIAYGLSQRGTSTGFVTAFLGGIVALAAALVACVVLLPCLAHLLGRLGIGVGGALARENTLRSAGRTAATGIAIAIGVTLITMMTVGAGSVRATLAGEVDARRPFDFQVSSASPSGTLPEDVLTRINGVEGVAASVEIRGAKGAVSGGSSPEAAPLLLEGRPDLSPVAHSEVEPVSDSEVRVSTAVADSGATLHVCGASDTCLDLTAVAKDRAPNDRAAISAANLERISPGAPIITAAVKLKDGADVSATESALLALDSSFEVGGAAQERAQYSKMIDVVLSVVIGLLAVAVLVALIGVTNTLSLSVAERTRENGLLRALGMTRRSVRRMLSAEALFISAAGALIGAALGIGFGIVGTYALPLDIETTIIEVPWAVIAAVIAVSVVAALVASWMPGRRAARTVPVEALAAE